MKQISFCNNEVELVVFHLVLFFNHDRNAEDLEYGAALLCGTALAGQAFKQAIPEGLGCVRRLWQPLSLQENFDEGNEMASLIVKISLLSLPALVAASS